MHLWGRNLQVGIKAYHSFKLLKVVRTIGWLSVPFVFIFPEVFNLVPFLIGVLFITALGSSAALHRYFSHKSFKTGPLRHWFLALVGTLSSQGSLALWTVYHHAHHKHSDTEHDPISPTFVGFWKAFFAIQSDTDYTDISKKSIVRELRDPAVKFFHDWYWPTIVLYVLILGLIDLTLIVNMYLLPLAVIRTVFGMQNTFGHGMPKLGYRRYETNDNTVNSPLTNILTFFLGETLHNTHHANPGKYNYSDAWYELDLTGLMIKYFFAKSKPA